MMHGNSFMLTAAEWLALNQNWNRGRTEPEADLKPEPQHDEQCYLCRAPKVDFRSASGAEICSLCWSRYLVDV